LTFITAFWEIFYEAFLLRLYEESHSFHTVAYNNGYHPTIIFY